MKSFAQAHDSNDADAPTTTVCSSTMKHIPASAGHLLNVQQRKHTNALKATFHIYFGSWRSSIAGVLFSLTR